MEAATVKMDDVFTKEMVKKIIESNVVNKWDSKLIKSLIKYHITPGERISWYESWVYGDGDIRITIRKRLMLIYNSQK